MRHDEKLSAVEKIMIEFAAETGLSPVGKVLRRYLWTDAFAVCNFFELYRQTNDEKYKDVALELIDQVHGVLGRHRKDDPRSGWISGFDENQGKLHPTKGGLRIGKRLNERRPDKLPDDRLEWDRDGQYYHYLTKWMHALNAASRFTGDMKYNKWAIELAREAHARFTFVPTFGSQKMMYWKMSIDLSYPLVASMGHHDALDGFITYRQLQMTSAAKGENSEHYDLTEEINDMAQICATKSWVTNDPLGIGGLLCDAFKMGQMISYKTFEANDLLAALLDDSRHSLSVFSKASQLNLPADYRLAFRELGLSIGLRAAERLRELIKEKPNLFNWKQRLHDHIEALMRYVPLAEIIESFWLEGPGKNAAAWQEHRAINSVMLATSLAPESYLTI